MYVSDPITTCTSGYDCTAALAPFGTTVGTSGYGSCTVTPSSVDTYGTNDAGAKYGICLYAMSPAIATCGNLVSNGNIDYYPDMAFGENSTVGDWRGAATNGGVGVALIHASFGGWVFLPDSQWPTVFAGMQLFSASMVAWGDTSDSYAWGYNIAYHYNVNPYGSVEEAILYGSGSDTSGSGCYPSTSNSMSFDGCGCWGAYTVSDNSTDAYYTLFEDWGATQYPTVGQSSATYAWWEGMCNYNTDDYPWTGGDVSP